MGAFGEGFATGFFNKLSEGMDTRQADARDYFNKQVETARTLGMENRRRSSAMIDESVSVAKRLQAMGVPKDIIMAQANMDPAGLGNFYNQADKLRLEANVPVDEAFWRDIYDLSGTFQAPDEDFNTFFSKIYGPIVQAAKEDPEGFKQDPKGTIWAKLFSGNAMDKARDKLATTEVVPGMTAEEAIAQGDTPRPNKVGGDSVVTVDPEALRRAAGPPDAPSPADMKSLREQFDGQFEIFMTKLTNEKDANGNPLYDPNKEASLGQMNSAARAAAYKALEEQFGGEEKYLSYLRSAYRLDEDGLPLDDTEAPTEPTGGATEPSPEETPTPTPEADNAVEPPPRPVTEPTEEPLSKGAQDFKNQYSTPSTIQLSNGSGSTTTLMYLRKEANGMVTYKDANTGEEVTDYPEEFAKRAE